MTAKCVERKKRYDPRVIPLFLCFYQGDVSRQFPGCPQRSRQVERRCGWRLCVCIAALLYGCPGSMALLSGQATALAEVVESA